MRYSTILGAAFYRIGLSSFDADLIDAHFAASAHHFLLLSSCKSAQTHDYHLSRHRAHLQALKEIIYLRGNFDEARDESLRGLDSRSNWNPDVSFSLPDPRMFESMNIDLSLNVGQPHPFDHYLAVQQCITTLKISAAH